MYPAKSDDVFPEGGQPGSGGRVVQKPDDRLGGSGERMATGRHELLGQLGHLRFEPRDDPSSVAQGVTRGG